MKSWGPEAAIARQSDHLHCPDGAKQIIQQPGPNPNEAQSLTGELHLDMKRHLKATLEIIEKKFMDESGQILPNVEKWVNWDLSDKSFG